jgi:predicted DNA-binding transcriptional regulator AlpA
MSDTDNFLPVDEAAAKLGIGVRTFYREIERGNIPHGTSLTDRIIRWRESVIDRVIADREAGRRSSCGEPF